MAWHWLWEVGNSFLSRNKPMYNGQRTKVRYLRKRMGFCVFVFTAVASHKVKKKKKRDKEQKS